VLSAAVAGCGSHGERASPRPDLGVPARLATCADWRRGQESERIGTLREIAHFAGGPVGSPAGRGPVLDEDEGYRHLQSYCANDFAAGFRLYKLYTRAAAFRGH
jgi:hypothetical protein